MSAERITLVLYSEDPDVFGKEYQSELQSFRYSLQKDGIEVSSSDTKMDSPAAGAGWVNEFLIPLIQVTAPVVGTLIGSWLQGKANRKVRLKLGDLEVDAQTKEEAEDQLRTLIELRSRLEKK